MTAANDSGGLLFSPEAPMELDTLGCAILIENLNQPCYCQVHPDYRSRIAKSTLATYRRFRERGLKHSHARTMANEVVGVECTDGPLIKWWREL